MNRYHLSVRFGRDSASRTSDAWLFVTRRGVDPEISRVKAKWKSAVAPSMTL